MRVEAVERKRRERGLKIRSGASKSQTSLVGGEESEK